MREEYGATNRLIANYSVVTEISTPVKRFFPTTDRTIRAITKGSTAVATRAWG